jgi:hypothetical protein
MNTRVFRHVHRQSAPHRPEPIRDSVALRWNHVVSCPARHPIGGQNNPRARYLSDAALRLAGIIAISSPSTALQIPIAG